MRRAALALAVLALLAPAAGAKTLQAGVQLEPIATGSLWKTGVLSNATMYAQLGNTTTLKVLDIEVPGQHLVGQPKLQIYGCQTTSTTVAPAVRADDQLGTATCTQIAVRTVREGQTVQIEVPLGLVGQYLSIQELAPLQSGTTTVMGTTWVETAIYPANPTAAGAPLATSRIYAGGPITYLPLPWAPGPTMQRIAYTSEAWVCRDKSPNTDPDPLRSLGCTRVNRNVNIRTAIDQPSVTFTLGGRSNGRSNEYQYLYLVGYATYDPEGPLKTQTYEVRGKAKPIRPLPAPKPTLAVDGMTITATFAPMAGVAAYRITATLPSTGSVVTGTCLGNAGQEICTVVATDPGTWTVSVAPLGKHAVGTAATSDVAIAPPA